MENGKYTIETDFGLSNNPKRQITFYKCLKGNDQAKKAFESLKFAANDVSDLIHPIKDVHPEYYNELLSTLRKINGLRHELQRQFDGYIMY